MRLPDATLMRRWQGDWSGGLNASEMFRNQGQTLNQAPNPAMYNRAPGSIGAAQNPVQPQPVGQATTFNGPIATSQMGSLPTGQAAPMAQTGVQAPMAQNSSTGTPYGVNYGDPNRQGSSFGAQRVGTYGSNPSQGSVFGETNIGLAGAENAQTGGLRGALNTVGMGADQARADLTQGGAGANNTLNRYYDPGYRANDYQAALSGALGGQAQQAAFDNFQNSPGQQYLVNESERAIRRNAAATGGLGGANVQRALQENAIGLAAQDFNNSFNRLGQVSDRGLGAGGQMAGNMMNTGSASGQPFCRKCSECRQHDLRHRQRYGGWTHSGWRDDRQQCPKWFSEPCQPEHGCRSGNVWGSRAGGFAACRPARWLRQGRPSGQRAACLPAGQHLSRRRHYGGASPEPWGHKPNVWGRRRHPQHIRVGVGVRSG
jgi:hypothetical protein